MSRRRPGLEGTRPTGAEVAALLAVCHPRATEAAAAHELGITVFALRGRKRRLYARLGVSSDCQALMQLLARGFLRVSQIAPFASRNVSPGTPVADEVETSG